MPYRNLCDNPLKNTDKINLLKWKEKGEILRKTEKFVPILEK